MGNIEEKVEEQNFLPKKEYLEVTGEFTPCTYCKLIDNHSYNSDKCDKFCLYAKAVLREQELEEKNKELEKDAKRFRIRFKKNK